MFIYGIDKNRMTFGWNHSTHQLFSCKLAKSSNAMLPAKAKFNLEIIRYGCVEPDFSRKNITKYIHGHFADIDNLSNDPPDARMLLSKYTRLAIEANSNRNYSKRDMYVGYALHFLQDMLNPLHVVFTPLEKNHPDRLFHKRFENIAEGLQGSVVNGVEFKENNLEKHFFREALPEAMRKAKNHLEKIKNHDFDNISEIAIQSLDNTYKTTDLYFKKLCREFNKAFIMNKNKQQVFEYENMLQD